MEYQRSDHEELLRLRDRLHKQNNVLQKMLWRIIELEKFRLEHEDNIDQLIDKDKAAEAVRKQNQLYLSRAQKLGAFSLFIIAILDFLRSFNLL